MGEDVEALFDDIRIVGQVEDPLARERGTAVYLCRNPKGDLDGLWSRRAAEVKAVFRR